MSTRSSIQARRDDRLDRLFGALSNRTRRALLERLGEAPANITDLAGPFDMSLPAVSKHIRVLERAGLVRRRVDGRVHRCAASLGPLAEIDRWLEERRAFWHDTLAALADHVERS